MTAPKLQCQALGVGSIFLQATVIVAIDGPKLPSMAKQRNTYLAPASPSLARRSSGKRMRFLFPLRPKGPPIKVNTFKLIAGPISKYK